MRFFQNLFVRTFPVLCLYPSNIIEMYNYCINSSPHIDFTHRGKENKSNTVIYCFTRVTLSAKKMR